MLAVYDRLLAALGARHEAPLDVLLDDLVSEVGAAAPLDDVALVAIRRAPVGSEPRRIRVPATADSVPVARAELRAWLAAIAAPADAAGDVLLAVGEAVANAIEHAYREGDAGDVELALTQPEPGVVVITVSDRGGWKEPVVAEHRGRGFGLMRVLMQEVVVDRGSGGTTVTMRRRVALRDEALLEAGPLPPDPLGYEVTVAYGVARLTGEVDLRTAEEIQNRLLDAIEGDSLTVDLSGVGHLDSAGARMLLVVAERLAGRLIVVAPAGTPPRRTLALSGLEDLLDVRG
jgi:anti-anti-sigma factor